MSNSTLFAHYVRIAFEPKPDGVVGLVDTLLNLCRLYQLQINFRDSRCFCRRLGADTQESFDIRLPKSVFRAALARIAAICNEQHPKSVTPYRGEGEIAVLQPVSADSQRIRPGWEPTKHPSPSTCYVSFTNTPSDQRFEMRFSRSSFCDKNSFTVLLRDKRTVTVLGHALKYVQNASNQTDYGSYGILSRTGGDEVLVALFPVSEVIGVFSGDIREPGGGAETGREAQRQRALEDPSQGI